MLTCSALNVFRDVLSGARFVPDASGLKGCDPFIKDRFVERAEGNEVALRFYGVGADVRHRNLWHVLVFHFQPDGVIADHLLPFTTAAGRLRAPLGRAFLELLRWIPFANVRLALDDLFGLNFRQAVIALCEPLFKLADISGTIFIVDRFGMYSADQLL